MKTKKLCNGFALVLMCCLIGYFMVTSVSSVSANQSYIPTSTNMIVNYDLTSTYTSLKPGDSEILRVVIQNTGGQKAEKTTVWVESKKNIYVSAYSYAGTVMPMETATIFTRLNVAEDAEIGLHSLIVRILYTGYDEKGEKNDYQERVWEIPIRIYGSPNFQLGPREMTYFKDIRGKLVLDGSTKSVARDVSVTMSSACISVIGSAKNYIGDLKARQNFVLEYQINPAQIGTCQLNFKMEYLDASSNLATETLSVGIDVQRSNVDLKVENVSYEGLAPGTAATLKVKLNNVGSAAADDVSVNLDLASPFTAIVSSEKYIGSIGSHKYKEIDFEILVDATADIKAYEIPMKIEYYDSTGTKQGVTKTIGVQVSGKPDIFVSIDKADLFTEGSRGTVNINVINKGFADVKFLNIKLLSTDNYDVISVDEVYIGNLDSDDTDTEEFEIQIKKNVPPGKIPLKIEVSYKEENSNIDYVNLRNVELNVLSKEEYAQKMPQAGIISLLLTAAGAIIGIIILLLAIWFIYKLLISFTGYLDRKIFKKKI